MAMDAATTRSRRALLGASLGAAAATIATALGRVTPTRAANGDTVTVGDYFAGNAEDAELTAVTMSIPSSTVFPRAGASAFSAAAIGPYRAAPERYRQPMGRRLRT